MAPAVLFFLPAILSFEQHDASSALLPSSAAPVCKAPSDRIWLFGTNHRTGTELNRMLMDHLTQMGMKVHEVLGPGSGRECLEQIERGGACRVPHLDINSTAEWHRMQRAAKRKGAELRLVHWVRHPVNLSISSYMYNRRTDEPWANKLWEDSERLRAACRVPCPEDCLPQTTCEALEQLGQTASSMSYRELLGELDLINGYLLSTWNDLHHGLHFMNSTMRALASVSAEVVSVDVDSVKEDCAATFSRVFTAIDGQPLDGCVRLACDAFAGANPSHQTEAEAKDAAEVVEVRANATRHSWVGRHFAPVVANFEASMTSTAKLTKQDSGKAELLWVSPFLEVAPSEPSGMVRRMQGMLNSLTNLGVVVHYVAHEKRDPMANRIDAHPAAVAFVQRRDMLRFYDGTLRQQLAAAIEAAPHASCAFIMYTTQTMRVTDAMRKGRADWYREGSDELPEEIALKIIARRLPGAATAVVTDDIHFERATTVLPAFGASEEQVRIAARWMRRRELSFYSSVSHIVTVSTEDIGRINTALKEPGVAKELSLIATPSQGPYPTWVPYTEEVLPPQDVAPWERREPGMLFVGVRHGVSAPAIDWLVTKVLPKVAALAKGAAGGEGEEGERANAKGGVAHLFIAGDGWEEAVKEGSGDHDGSRTDCACKAPLLKAAVDAGNVTILGRVPDDELGALMQRYRVFASPLFGSTGVATKNLAAMAAGAPLVTTSSGLQGLKLALQQAVLPVADDAYTFSRLLLLLQRNSDAFLAAQTRGLDHARDYLSAEASRAALYDVLAKTVDPRMLRLPSEPMEPDLPFSHRLLSTAAQRRERLLQRVDAPPERAKFADVLVSPGSRTTALALDAPDSAGKEMAALVAHATEGVRSLLAGTASQAGAELGACRQLIEKDGAAERGEVVLAVGGPSQQQVNDEATPAQLQDGAAQALLARAAAHATAAGGAEHALLLRGCALQQAATLPFSEDKARGALSRAGIRWAGDEGLRQENVLRCPLAAGGSPHRQDARSVSNVSQQLLKLQATLLSAGGGKPSNSSTASALNWPRLSPMVFESGDWPKLAGPAAAKGQELRMLDPVTHLQEHDGVMTKLVNLKRRLEVRKVWKAGSTMIGPLLDCVQPGEWQDVRQSTATPRGYNVHALVKEPIKRFSAALAEVVRRAFFGICPSGACTAETDGWMPEKLQHKLRRETSWYDKAAALLLADANASKGDGANATIGDDVALHSFLAAAVNTPSVEQGPAQPHTETPHLTRNRPCYRSTTRRAAGYIMRRSTSSRSRCS